MLVNTKVAEEALRLGQPTLPGTITRNPRLAYPVLTGGQVTGILSVQNLELESVFFDEFDVQLLKMFASSMSIALENARLYRRRVTWLSWRNGSVWGGSCTTL